MSPRGPDHGGGHGAHVGAVQAVHVEVTVLLDACEQLLLVIVLLARTVLVQGAQGHVTLDLKYGRKYMKNTRFSQSTKLD